MPEPRQDESLNEGEFSWEKWFRVGLRAFKKTLGRYHFGLPEEFWQHLENAFEELLAAMRPPRPRKASPSTSNGMTGRMIGISAARWASDLFLCAKRAEFGVLQFDEVAGANGVNFHAFQHAPFFHHSRFQGNFLAIGVDKDIGHGAFVAQAAMPGQRIGVALDQPTLFCLSPAVIVGVVIATVDWGGFWHRS